ncbi:MAG: biopolymer transporter ExbD [Spirochaetota bacterium]|jgi:biopolymer transport protein ExbD|nr:biopolymer transporter ExbD [Spirochaetota bacterium]
MHFKRKLRNQVGIDMTPMIDCVFLLLIFFMITSSIIREQGIQVRLPRSDTSALLQSRDLVLSINRENEIYLGDLHIAKNDLFDRLRQEFAQPGRELLIIRADTLIEYGILIEVMDIARRAGIYNVSLSTRR